MKLLKVMIPIVVLLLLGYQFLSEYRKISAYPITSWLKDHEADCGVVLTGGPGRVREGFDLLSQGMIKKLIISGVHPKAQLREIFPQRSFYPTVSEKDVVLEKRSTTTYGNVHQSLPLVEALRCRSVVLITSKVHMYRAKRSFEAVASDNLDLYERSVASGSEHGQLYELLLETIKSVFYSYWAY